MNAMKKMIAVAAVAVAGFAAFAAGEGAAPMSSDTYSFTYQACLRDEHGNVITKDGAVQRNQVVILRLWPTAAEGGTPLWARKFAVFTDETGLFNLEVSDSVGSQEPALTNSLAGAISSQKAGQLYIGLQVENSAGEIVPRQRVFAVPFASVANDVRAITQDIPVSGKLTFGTGTNTVSVTQDGIEQKGSYSKFDAIRVGMIQPSTGKTNDNVKVHGDLAVSGRIFSLGGTSEEDYIPVPIGGIIMWTKEELPEPKDHWAICDGNTYEGVTTPNLTDRFIVGASKTGGSYRYGATGGEATVKLTGEQTPTRDHTHYYWGGFDELIINEVSQGVAEPRPQYQSLSMNSSLANTSFRYETSKANGTGDADIKPHENRPPYYALYYIMRVK